MIPEHYDQGWHNTGTIGHFGAAAGVAKLLHLDPGSIVNAIGIAATQAAGLRQVFGTMCKPLHAGKAAMNGLLSALWAGNGMDSSADSLDGELGFLRIYSSNPHPEKVTQSLSAGYHILKARFKDYPSCRGTHAVIDGVVELRKKHPVPAEQVKEIHCTVAPLSYEICKNPSPQTGMEGKFSLAHCAAAAWVEGPLYCSHFNDERMADPVISRLRDKVKLSTDPSLLTSQSKIVMILESGLKYEFFSDIYRAEKEKTNRERLYHKSYDILDPLIGREKLGRLIRAIEGLDRLESISEVTRCLV
jgi:2-methylcitrate dehydratase PrpD